MAILKVDTVSGIGTEGTVFEGDITFDSLNYMTLPKGTTTQRGSARGIFACGDNPTGLSSIDYIEIQSSGIAQDFGSATGATQRPGGCGSSTRGLIAGGYVSPAYTNTIEYITISTTSNATNFGDLTVARWYAASLANETRGVFAGGYVGGGNNSNTIGYVTIASAGNASDFGDISATRREITAASTTTRGIYAG